MLQTLVLFLCRIITFLQNSSRCGNSRNNKGRQQVILIRAEIVDHTAERLTRSAKTNAAIIYKLKHCSSCKIDLRHGIIHVWPRFISFPTAGRECNQWRFYNFTDIMRIQYVTGSGIADYCYGWVSQVLV